MRTSRTPPPKTSIAKKRSDIVPETTRDLLVDKIISHWKRSAEAYLDAGVELFKLEKSNKTLYLQVTRELKNRKIMNKTTIGQLRIIGEQEPLLRKYFHQLPTSYHSLHQLSLLPHDKLTQIFKSKQVTQSSTLREIEQLGPVIERKENSSSKNQSSKQKEKGDNDLQKSITIDLRPTKIIGKTKLLKDILEQLDRLMKEQSLGAKIETHGLLKKRMKDEL